MDVLYTKDLTISYDNTTIVSGLNMNIPKGKITIIIGPNGCGKSTILKTVARVIKPKSGSVYLNNKKINKLSSIEIAKEMAVLSQSPEAPGGLTVNELVSYGRFPHQKGFGKLKEEDKKVVKWAMKETKMEEFGDRNLDTLSGGQRQRAWIAMALAQQTDLILLDEPTTYLDLAHQLEVLELLKELNQKENRTIVMVLHELNLSARFADYMIAVKKGKIISEGEPKEVMSPNNLREVFNIEAQIVSDPIYHKPVCITYDIIKNGTPN